MSEQKDIPEKSKEASQGVFAQIKLFASRYWFRGLVTATIAVLGIMAGHLGSVNAERLDQLKTCLEQINTDPEPDPPIEAGTEPVQRRN